MGGPLIIPPSIPQDVIAVRRDIPKDTREQIVDSLIKMKDNDDGRAWLARHKNWVTDWAPVTDEDYDRVRAMALQVVPKMQLELKFGVGAGPLPKLVTDRTRGWFEQRKAESQNTMVADISIRHTNNQFSADLTIRGRSNPDTERFSLYKAERLADLLAERIKATVPRESYVSSRVAGNWIDHGLEVNLGSADGIRKGDAAAIRRAGSYTQDVQRGNDILGLVAEVEPNKSYIKPLATLKYESAEAENDETREKDAGVEKERLKGAVEQDLEDRVVYRTSVTPSEQLLAIDAAMIHKELDRKDGKLKTRLKFTLAGEGPSPIADSGNGVLLEVTLDNAEFLNGKHTATVFLPQGAPPNVQLEVESERTQITIAGELSVGRVNKEWRVWPTRVLFACALIGGIVGGAVRGRTWTEWRKVLLEASLGGASGVLMLLLLLALPGIYKVFLNANTASEMTCFVIGLAGGYLGIAGLLSLLGSGGKGPPKAA